MSMYSTSLHSSAIPLSRIQPQQAQAPSWRDYPTSIEGHNAITTPGKNLSDRLSALGEILFSDEINFRVVDIRCDNGRLLCVANKDSH